MKVWVTRAEPGASRTAARLRVLEHDPVIAPLLEARPLAAAIDLDGVAALAFTSINGVEAFARLCAPRALPVYAVGAATAKAARAAGFTAVASADGDVEALAALIAAAPPPPGLVLTPGAREPAGDLVGELAVRGVTARAVAVYETVALGPPVPDAEAVLIHSPKAAVQLARLLTAGAAARLTACCISPAAAAPLAGLPLRAVALAPRPDEAALLALLDP